MKRKRSSSAAAAATSRAKRMRPVVVAGLANVPQSAMQLIASKLGGKNVASLYVTSPKYVRNVLKPKLNTQKKVATLRQKLGFNGTVNTRMVNPAYVQIVNRLKQINNTPNNNYYMRGEYGTGYHARRIQNLQNLLGRLEQTNTNYYRNRANPNKHYEFSKNGGQLVAVPVNPQGVYVTIARGLTKRPNGTLFFNLRKRRERSRRLRV